MTLPIDWRDSPTDHLRMLSPLGLRLIDDLTGRDPFGNLACALLLKRAPGDWRPADVRAARNAGGIVIFPGLGRSREVDAQPPRRYRAVITAEFYRPFYARTQDGIEFDVYPYNDDQPPAQLPMLQNLVLVPATNYPFPPHVRVLRGEVRNTAGPVANAEVYYSNKERVLSDDNGGYALPLRLPTNNTPIPIHAVDYRSGENGQIDITLPRDIGISKVIIIA